MALETFPNLSSILIYFTTLSCDILNKTLNPTLQQREQPYSTPKHCQLVYVANATSSPLGILIVIKWGLTRFSHVTAHVQVVPLSI